MPLPEIGGVAPDVYGSRTEGRQTFGLVALIRAGLGQAVEGYAQLAAAKAALGDDLDYALVLPPAPEFELIRFLTADKGKWFYHVKKLRLMMWLCNPERNTMSCVVGAPRDRLLESHFLHGYHPLDSYVSTLLSKELMKDGDF
ncbi:MAG: hypothetical protein HY671_08020 [Chloroflexi bacterium]|nr:hypothetical protein [Chloroflexota bacterium]